MNESTLPQIPQALLELMARVGPIWREDVPGNVQLMIDNFSPILSRAPKNGIDVRREISYGEYPRQVLDVYSPENQGSPRPAVLFVHGGAFISGHRNRSNEIYGNVLYCLARHRIVGINVEYRLADDAKYPEATRDVASAVGWVSKNCRELDVDPARIFLFGHSAGAAHAGSYAYDSRHHPASGPGIAGFIVLSGRVRADNRLDNPNARKVEAYYGPNNAIYEDVSPVTHVGVDSVPTFVAWSEFENPLLDVYCAELVYRLAVAKGKAPPSLWLRGHNHTSGIAHLNTANSFLEKMIIEFIRRPS